MIVGMGWLIEHMVHLRSFNDLLLSSPETQLYRIVPAVTHSKVHKVLPPYHDGNKQLLIP